MDCLVGIRVGHYHASLFFNQIKTRFGKKGSVYTDEANWSNDAYKWLRINHIVYEIDFKNTMSD